MSSGFPNYRPVPQYVVDELNLKKKAVYTSRLNSWIRLIGNSGNGLVLQSNRSALEVFYIHSLTDYTSDKDVYPNAQQSRYGQDHKSIRFFRKM